MLRRALTTLAVLGLGPFAQGQVSAPPNLKPSPSDPALLAIRTARDRLFNMSTSAPMRLLEESNPDAPPPVTIVDRIQMPELPAAPSGVVVIGTVTSAQPYLSGDRKRLYTEYTVQVSGALKPAGARFVNNQLELVEFGGAARLPNGRVIRNDVHGVGILPEVSGRYVMFLTYSPDGDCYRQLKLWRLSGGYAIPQSEADLALAGQGKSHYSGMAEAAFIEAVRNAIR